MPMNFFFQWKETTGNQLMDSKLRCVFILDDAVGDSGTSTVNSHEYLSDKMEEPIVKNQTVPLSPKVSP